MRKSVFNNKKFNIRRDLLFSIEVLKKKICLKMSTYTYIYFNVHTRVVCMLDIWVYHAVSCYVQCAYYISSMALLKTYAVCIIKHTCHL